MDSLEMHPETIERELAPPVSGGAEEAHLWQQWSVDRNQLIREKLVAYYLPYVRMIAATYYSRRIHDEIEFEEYYQFASLGLLEALNRFDTTRGILFKTYASRRMHGAILDGLERLTEKNQQISVRTRLRKERIESVKDGVNKTEGDSPDDLFRYLAEVGIGIALGILLDGTGMYDPEEENVDMGSHISPEISYFRRDELKRLQGLVKEALSKLGKQEQLVIRYHYLQGIQFEEISRIFGLTKGRISQIHRQALSKLHMALADAPSCDIAL